MQKRMQNPAENIDMLTKALKLRPTKEYKQEYKKKKTIETAIYGGVAKENDLAGE